MPIVSMFFGIVIRMFYNDHEPPHFHAEYQGQRGKFDLNGEMMVGNIQSRRGRRLTRGWTLLHQAEISANWQRIKAGEPSIVLNPYSNEECTMTFMPVVI